MKFKDFLMTEAMVSIDADDPDGAAKLRRAKTMDAATLAKKSVMAAREKARDVRTQSDPADPTTALKRKKANLDAAAADTAAQIARMDKRT